MDVNPTKLNAFIASLAERLAETASSWIGDHGHQLGDKDKHDDRRRGGGDGGQRRPTPHRGAGGGDRGGDLNDEPDEVEAGHQLDSNARRVHPHEAIQLAAQLNVGVELISRQQQVRAL